MHSITDTHCPVSWRILHDFGRATQGKDAGQIRVCRCINNESNARKDDEACVVNMGHKDAKITLNS